jgi:serpin B
MELFMLKELFTLLFAASLFISCNDSPIDYQLKNQGTVGTAEKKVSGAADKFGLKLFKEINAQEDTDKNIFISPLSVSYALGMALNGAAGSTYEDMKSTLELNGLTDKEINEAYKKLSAYLMNADPEVILNIANSIWYRQGFSIQQEFINTNKEYFSAEVTGMDFTNPNSVDIINSWVSSKTNGLIKEILDEIQGDVIMYLINAVYFKGTWTYSFPKEGTAPDNFYLSDGTQSVCTMMSQCNKLNYMENELFQAVRLPYGDGGYYMTVLLPKGNNNINDVIDRFSSDNWKLWNDSFAEKEGNLWLPKFKTEYKLIMNDVLTALGMGIAFNGNADFTGINSNGGLFISRVLHKTYVDVNEEGTEAAAVTAVEIRTTSIGGSDNSFYMKVNRPFVFTITEKETGSMLFVGKIVKP